MLTQEGLATLMTSMMAQTGSLGQPLLIPISMAGSIGGQGGLAVLTLPTTNVATLSGLTAANAAGNLLKLPFAGLQGKTHSISVCVLLVSRTVTRYRTIISVKSLLSCDSPELCPAPTADKPSDHVPAPSCPTASAGDVPSNAGDQRTGDRRSGGLARQRCLSVQHILSGPPDRGTLHQSRHCKNTALTTCTFLAVCRVMSFMKCTDCPALLAHVLYLCSD